ncbi:MULTISPECIES: hypothetical protein [Methylobacterium]|uniref:hypothetical protein n=1 Tax=Methylobacterium TaxID=407 RepID=UPI00272DC92E|nr:hypothetical protein [Methylobacterium sp.]
MSQKSNFDRASILRAAWTAARAAAAAAGEGVRAHIGAAMKAAWGAAKAAAMTPQQAQLQQANAGAARIEALHARIRELAGAPKLDLEELAPLFAQMPGVTHCVPEPRSSDRLSITATGTRCGTLDRPYTIPFLMDAFAIPAIPRVNESLDDAIERNDKRKAKRAAEIERDGFDRAVDRTIIKGPYRAEVVPAGGGEIAVVVFADLADGTEKHLGAVVMDPLPTRREVIDFALGKLGYYSTIDMDADDGSEISTAKLADLESRLARR